MESININSAAKLAAKAAANYKAPGK